MMIIELILLFYVLGNFVIMGAGGAEFSCDKELKLTIGKVLFPGWILGFYLGKLFSIKIGNIK